MQDRVTKRVIKQINRLVKNARRQEKKRFKKLERASKPYSLQSKENSKVDFRGLAGKKNNITPKPRKTSWPNLLGWDKKKA